MSVVLMWYVGVTATLACALGLVICVQWVVDRVRDVQRGPTVSTSETPLETAAAAPADGQVPLPRVDLRPPAERGSPAVDSGSGELLTTAGGGA